MPRYFELGFVLLLLLPGTSRAQNRGSISGFVRDVEAGETLLLANVVLEGTGFGSATNDAGYYTLTGLPAGEFVLRVSFVGYTVFRQTLALGTDEHVRRDIELIPEDLYLDNVTVEAERVGEEESRRLGLTKMSTAQIRQLPAILEPDVFRSLQLLPGIKAASDYSSGLYIRGGTPDQTLILLDGTTVYNPSHFFGFFSTFNPDAIKDVRLFKGGFPAEYGGRIGSVIDIHNKDGNRNRFHGRISLGLLASRILLEGPYRRGSWMIAFRRSTLDPILAALRKQDIDGIPDRFYFFDWNAKINLDLTPNDKLSLSTYSGRDNLNLPILEDTRIILPYGNRTISANWTRILSIRTFTSVTLTSSRYFSKPRFEIASTPFSRDNTVDDVSLKVDIEYLPNEWHNLKIGGWGGLIEFRLEDHFDGRQSFLSEIETGYASLYAQHTYKHVGGLSVLSGLRAAYFGKGRYFRVEPRFSLEYAATENMLFQIGAGRYHQFLTLITNEAFAGFDIWLTTGEGVQPAFGDQLVGGVKMALPSGLRLDAEAYYRTMQDLFVLDPFLSDAAGIRYADLFQIGRGYAYGMELFLERSTGRLNGFVGYTFSVTRRRFPLLNDNRYFPPKYDRTHDLKIVVNIGLGRSWTLTSSWIYATGQAYTEPASYYVLVNFPFKSDKPFAIISPFNRARLPDYHRLDLSVERSGRFFGFADYTLQLQVINAYMRRNIWFYFFDSGDTDSVDRTEVPQIPVPIPNISLTLDF